MKASSKRMMSQPMGSSAGNKKPKLKRARQLRQGLHTPSLGWLQRSGQAQITQAVSIP